MNTLMQKKSVVILAILLGFFSFLTITSCHKEKPGKAVITVLDSLNAPVYGAVVSLNSDNNPEPGVVKDKKTTDNNGKTYHEFPLEVILQVEVSKGTLIAPKSNIHIIQGETANLTVKLK